MKLIHCADLHLDAKLQAHLDRERAKRRRDELLRNFARLADYAEQQDVDAVLIAGDLFDKDRVSALAKNTVLNVIGAHPGIRFYYLRGNHDTADCLRGSSAGAGMPENLFLFGNRWKTYREGAEGRIVIAGIELTRENNAAAFAALRLDPSCFNIVLLHGQETSASGFSGAEDKTGGRIGVISLPALRGRGIDYLALGHIHAWKKAPLDSRGTFCYPGCLEGRGFDESGPHGFALLEIDEQRNTMTHRFVPFAQRALYTVDVDVTGCLTTAEMEERVKAALREAGCGSGDMADVTMRGELDVECEKDAGYLRTGLEARFFFARLQDRTTLRIDPQEYLYDESLRGEFVRVVLADSSIPEEEKTAVIRCGFQAMDGEALL